MMIDDRVMNGQERISFRLRSLYSEYGYERYRMSKFEEYDLYSRNKDFLFSESVITFTDTNGRLMALKPDVTLSIVKNRKDTPGEIQKLYYHENVYRVSTAADGFREQTQVGLECMGAVDSACIAEVLKLAAESLRLCSEKFVLEISHVGILSAFVDAIAPDAAVREEILKCAGQKNLHGISRICRDNGLAEGAEDALKQLLGLYFGIVLSISLFFSHISLKLLISIVRICHKAFFGSLSYKKFTLFSDTYNTGCKIFSKCIGYQFRFSVLPYAHKTVCGSQINSNNSTHNSLTLIFQTNQLCKNPKLSIHYLSQLS